MISPWACTCAKTYADIIFVTAPTSWWGSALDSRRMKILSSSCFEKWGLLSLPWSWLARDCSDQQNMTEVIPCQFQAKPNIRRINGFLSQHSGALSCHVERHPETIWEEEGAPNLSPASQRCPPGCQAHEWSHLGSFRPAQPTARHNCLPSTPCGAEGQPTRALPELSTHAVKYNQLMVFKPLSLGVVGYAAVDHQNRNSLALSPLQRRRLVRSRSAASEHWGEGLIIGCIWPLNLCFEQLVPSKCQGQTHCFKVKKRENPQFPLNSSGEQHLNTYFWMAFSSQGWYGQQIHMGEKGKQLLWHVF